MRLDIIGSSGSGKSTVFDALTESLPDQAHRGENRIGTIKVPDNRVDVLSTMYKPQKTIHASVEYFLPAGRGAEKDAKGDQNFGAGVRDSDALIQVVRNFSVYGIEKPSPADDFNELNQEMILADLVVVEKRLERLGLDRRRGKTVNEKELSLLIECRESLENEKPLRRTRDLATAHLLKGFAFVSAKPMLVLLNNEDEDDTLPDMGDIALEEECMVIRGKLEQELGQMTEDEGGDFLKEFDISASATDRVIEQSYSLLGLISFFTVGEDEVRAWTIHSETKAVDAAEVIHSDIKKGFIRAEVVSYEDLMEAGNHQEAKKKGKVRLEGKEYTVKDGDIINFRFNV